MKRHNDSRHHSDAVVDRANSDKITANDLKDVDAMCTDQSSSAAPRASTSTGTGSDAVSSVAAYQLELDDESDPSSQPRRGGGGDRSRTDQTNVKASVTSLATSNTSQRMSGQSYDRLALRKSPAIASDDARPRRRLSAETHAGLPPLSTLSDASTPPSRSIATTSNSSNTNSISSNGHPYSIPSPELLPIPLTDANSPARFSASGSQANDALTAGAAPASASQRKASTSTSAAADAMGGTSSDNHSALSTAIDEEETGLMRSPPLISTATLINGHGRKSSTESTPSIVEIESSPPPTSASEERLVSRGRLLAAQEPTRASTMLTPEASSLFNPLASTSPSTVDESVASTSAPTRTPRSGADPCSTPALGPDGQPTVASLTISPMPFHHITFATPSMESSFERTPMLDDPDHMRQLADPPTFEIEDERHQSAADFSAALTAAQETEEACRQRDAAKAARLMQYQERMRQRMVAAGKSKDDDSILTQTNSSPGGAHAFVSNGDARMTGPGSNMVRGRRTSSAASTLAIAVHAAKLRTPNLKDMTILPARPPHDLAPETRFNHIVLTTHWLDDNAAETISLAHLSEYHDLLDLPPEYLASEPIDLSLANLPELPSLPSPSESGLARGVNGSAGPTSVYSSNEPTPPSSIQTQYPDVSFPAKGQWRGASLAYPEHSHSAPSPPVFPSSTRLTADALANGHLAAASMALKRSRTSDGGSSRGSKKRVRESTGRSRSPTPPPFEPTGEEPAAWQVQSSSCLSKRLDGHPRCHLCVDSSRSSMSPDEQACAFRAIRSFGVDANGTIVASPRILDLAAEADEEPQFAQMPTREQADEIRTAIAPSLSSLLEQDLRHAALARVVRMPRDLRSPTLCDTCLASPIAGDWICETCGRSACLRCHETLVKIDGAVEAGTLDLEALTTVQQRRRKCLSARKRTSTPEAPHSSASFVPLTRLGRSDLRALHADVVRWKSEHPSPSVVEAMSPQQIAASYSDNPILASERPGLVLNVAQLSHELWHQVWARHEPLLFDGAAIDDLAAWTPDLFSERFGDVTLTLESHKSGERGPALASYFFRMYGQPKRDSRSWKVREFPAEGLREALPDLTNAYLAALPLPEVLRPDGVLNPLSHVPLNALEPEVGPRCVFTWAGRGSTLLHMESADHANLMTYSSKMVSDVPGSARWDIFRYEDSDVVRAFIHELVAKKIAKAGTTKAQYRDAQDDPLFMENVFLDASLRAELFKQTSVRPYTIWQGVGQFVVVPAGCAFQVTTFDDCLSYAHDFVSGEHVARSLQIDALSRKVKRPEQANVQLGSALYWAWQSISTSLTSHHPHLTSLPSGSYTALPPLPPIPGSANVSPHAPVVSLPLAVPTLPSLPEPDSDGMDVEDSDA